MLKSDTRRTGAWVGTFRLYGGQSQMDLDPARRTMTAQRDDQLTHQHWVLKPGQILISNLKFTKDWCLCFFETDGFPVRYVKELPVLGILAATWPVVSSRL